MHVYVSLDADMYSNHKQERNLWCDSSEDLTALIAKITVFGDIMPCSAVEGGHEVA
jgi:hypothetical protein